MFSKLSPLSPKLVLEFQISTSTPSSSSSTGASSPSARRRVRLWVQDSLGVCVVYPPQKKKKILTKLNIFFYTWIQLTKVTSNGKRYHLIQRPMAAKVQALKEVPCPHDILVIWKEKIAEIYFHLHWSLSFSNEKKTKFVPRVFLLF